jgi:hypothetical protein
LPASYREGHEGYLAWHDVPFPKTHDLALIGGLCVEHDRSLETICRTAEELTVFAWVFRYPGDPAEPTWQEAGAAIGVTGLNRAGFSGELVA